MRSCFLTLGLLATLAASTISWAPVASAQGVAPFEKLAGRWVGQGILGIKSGSKESVKCRVTYVLAEQGKQLRQTIRCASSGGLVEVQSTLTEAAGALSGQWHELTREWGGDLSGAVTPRGLRVTIKGSDFNANMEVILKDDRQVIEMQFIDSSLIGMTLVLTKG